MNPMMNSLRDALLFTEQKHAKKTLTKGRIRSRIAPVKLTTKGSAMRTFKAALVVAFGFVILIHFYGWLALIPGAMVACPIWIRR